MRIETLKDRIDKATAKIEKKNGTITKKKALIEKKKANIMKMGYNPNGDPQEIRMYSLDAYWLICDIGYLEDDIKRLTKEIAETKNSLAKYEAQMAGLMDQEKALSEIPETLKKMQTDLVEKWDVWDKEYRAKLREDGRTMEYKDYCKKYSYYDRSVLYYRTDDQIHAQNVQDSKVLILDLIRRVEGITGEITDWSGVHATIGTHGFSVLNGYVIGKEGRARVESITAGGYNIQRLHVRVLVHEK